MSTTTHLNLDLNVFAKHRPPVGTAIAARIRGFGLDFELATGADPGSSEVLAARAELICRFDRRELTARRLREAARGTARYGVGSGRPPSRKAVEAARTDLESLANELSRPGPADPQGVALAQLLVTDGSGPLYPPARGRALCAQAQRAEECLRRRRERVQAAD